VANLGVPSIPTPTGVIGDLVSRLTGGKTGLEGRDTLKLLVNGKAYEGWQQITVKRSLKAISGSFQLAVVDRWAEEKVAWAIAPGNECQVLIGSDTVITGYVDDVSPKFDANSRSLSVSGRDKTLDMVDCSIDQKPGSWTNISLLALAKKLAAPFGVKVRLDSGISAGDLFLSWKIQQGETCFESLDRAARLRGLLLINDGLGSIVITRAGSVRSGTELVQGQNILEASAQYSQKERFSEYTVKGQAAGLDEADPDVDFTPSATAKDSGVSRYRPLIIIAEGAVTKSTCQLRAKWEASVRVGKSSKISVKIPGWRQNDGKLWTVNQVTQVKAPWLGIDLDMLITEVTFAKGDGTTTDLQLEPTAAYVPDPTLINKKDPWRQLVLQESKR
jgi:prophage tail gpP-like protein